MTMLIISGLTLYMLYSMITQHMNHITNKIFPSDTQSANDTQVAGIPDSWLEVWDPPDFVGSDGADVDAFVYKVRVEGDWPVVLGTYEHYKDENFAEYLKASGIPAFMVSIILSTVPIVTIKKIPADSDYYYDIDYNNVKDRDNVYGDLAEEDSTAFQMLIKTETWIRDIEMRFQLGQAFHHIEPDESESQNTFWFAEPRVLLQDKTRVADRHRIIYQFGPEGYNTTLVDLSRNITAKRHFRRTQPETQEEKKLRTSMVTATENGMTTLEEESNVTLSEGVIGADGERFINDTQMLSSERKEIVLEAGNITVGDGFGHDGWENLKENETLVENENGNTENEEAVGIGETHKERESVVQENRDSFNSTAGEQKENNDDNNDMTNSNGTDKIHPAPESNFEAVENATAIEER